MYQSILFHRRRKQYLVEIVDAKTCKHYQTHDVERAYTTFRSLIRIYSDGRKTISPIADLTKEVKFDSDPLAPEGYFMVGEIEHESGGIFLVESTYNGQERLIQLEDGKFRFLTPPEHHVDQVYDSNASGDRICYKSDSKIYAEFPSPDKEDPIIIYELRTPPLAYFHPWDDRDITAIYQDYNYRILSRHIDEMDLKEPFAYIMSHNGTSLKGNSYTQVWPNISPVMRDTGIIHSINNIYSIKRRGYIHGGGDKIVFIIPRGKSFSIVSRDRDIFIINPSKKKHRTEKKAGKNPILIPSEFLIRTGGSLEYLKVGEPSGGNARWKYPPTNPEEIPFPGIRALGLFSAEEGDWEESSIPIEPDSTWNDLLDRIPNGTLTNIKLYGGLLSIKVWNDS